MTSTSPPLSFHCSVCSEHVRNCGDDYSELLLLRCNFHRLTDPDRQQYQHVHVTCPKCKRGLYHCTLCQYNSDKPSNVMRHRQRVHKLEPQSHDIRVSKPKDDSLLAESLSDMMDVDFSCNTNDSSDDFQTTDASSAENDTNHNEHLPGDASGNCYDKHDDNPSDDDIFHDQYLLSLITDAADNDYEHVADDDITTPSTPTPMNIETGMPPTASLSVTQFESMFPNNHGSQVYFWEAYRHRLLKGEPFGGMKGLFTRSTRQVFHSNEDNLMSLDDAAIMFKIMDHALNCKGEQKANFLDIAVGLFRRMPSRTSLECFMSTLNLEQKDSFDNFVSSLNEEQRKYYAKKLLPSDDNTVPQSEKEVIELLLKGKYAAFTNVASTKANIYKEHAVVSIVELLDHIIAHGVPIAWMQDGMGGSINHDMNKCEAAKAELEDMRRKWDDPDKVAVGLLLFWSDGFRKCNKACVLCLCTKHHQLN